MAGPSVSRPGGDDPARPLKLYAGVSAHLVTVDEQNVPAGCFLCRQAFAADEPGLPCCERCGAVPLQTRPAQTQRRQGQ